jgi:hypothetical protein
LSPGPRTQFVVSSSHGPDLQWPRNRPRGEGRAAPRSNTSGTTIGSPGRRGHRCPQCTIEIDQNKAIDVVGDDRRASVADEASLGDPRNLACQALTAPGGVQPAASRPRARDRSSRAELHVRSLDHMSEIEPCAFMSHYQDLAVASHLGGRSFLSELCASSRRQAYQNVAKTGPKMLNARSLGEVQCPRHAICWHRISC